MRWSVDIEWNEVAEAYTEFIPYYVYRSKRKRIRLSKLARVKTEQNRTLPIQFFLSPCEYNYWIKLTRSIWNNTISNKWFGQWAGCWRHYCFTLYKYMFYMTEMWLLAQWKYFNITLNCGSEEEKEREKEKRNN